MNTLHPSHASLIEQPLAELMPCAEATTLAGFGPVVSYSRKVFIPLTQLCRDVCHYCVFAQRPKQLHAPYLELDEVEAIARAGDAAGCREALFTLGDKPELRYRAAREWLDERGYASTIDYLVAAARRVREATGLLPHINAGVMTSEDYDRLRPLAPSMGLMLESLSERLCQRGGAHFGSPDKAPAVRLESIRLAGERRIPFTTGLLIGIGETRAERLEALQAIAELHARYGHIQEVIIQNFRAKPGTVMADAPEPSLDEHLWTIAAARMILGPEMSIQAPPNLHDRAHVGALIRAGVNDWGGVSPVTPDHVNPEAPWPHLEVLETDTAAAGRVLRQRLTVGPAMARDPQRWIDPALHAPVRRAIDAQGLVREQDWHTGTGELPPLSMPVVQTAADPFIAHALQRAERGQRLDERDIARLFTAQERDLERVVSLADQLRRDRIGDQVTYVVNRNINYTNICLYKCGFCAFSKGSPRSERGPAYNIDHTEIARRTVEAAERGASEVCLQGGIHPSFDGNTYLGIVRAVKQAVPEMHVHAFSPLEVQHGATTLGLSLHEYLARLRDAGLASLPGTAAEVLSDPVRAQICADKLTSDEWLAVIRAAHEVGLRTTATIMFGHVDGYADWATHLVRIRDLQLETGGFTEFVPLPFVHMEAPMWRKGLARSGPTWREVRLMHAIARIVFHRSIDNIQASWVKLGIEGVAALLDGGVNDLGGTLMDESITRAAGGANGQLCDESTMQAIADRAGRPLVRRSTLYGAAPVLAGYC
ncbi:MAG: 5-amino-6-(D-ribitylamino)uracil--L-tyrosine 4-hydroxyphenyl transferase CofH [Pseudoxanthomonas sp.]